MGVKFDKNYELIDVLKSFKLKGVKVVGWHPQFRWWGNVVYGSLVRTYIVVFLKMISVLIGWCCLTSLARSHRVDEECILVS